MLTGVNWLKRLIAGLLTEQRNRVLYQHQIEYTSSLVEKDVLTGVNWLKRLIAGLPTEQRNRVIVSASNRIYKFAGGERRANRS